MRTGRGWTASRTGKSPAVSPVQVPVLVVAGAIWVLMFGEWILFNIALYHLVMG
jgi:hypothetical protein